MPHAASHRCTRRPIRIRIRSYTIAASVVSCLCSLSAHALPMDDARAQGLKWLLQNQSGDGALLSSNSAGALQIQTTSASVEVFQRNGLNESPQQARALAWLANAQASSTDALVMQINALKFAERDVTSRLVQLANMRNTFVRVETPNVGIDYGHALWGPYAEYSPNLIDTPLALGALRTANYTYSTTTNDTSEIRKTIMCRILPAQLNNAPWQGSWPYSLPTQINAPAAQSAIGALLPTAAVLYELKLQDKSRLADQCSQTVASIDSKLTQAKNWLLAQTNSDNGFAERNPQTGALEASNVFLTTFAIRALQLFASTDSDSNTAINNARNWLLSQQKTNGSWQDDAFITARVLSVLPSATGAQLEDGDKDGLPNVVEVALGTNPNAADSQDKLPDTTNPGGSGTRYISFSQQVKLNNTFNYNINWSEGIGPFTYQLNSGSLPPGTSLSSAGSISGRPSALGNYAFDYIVTDSTGKKATVLGRIDVLDPNQPTTPRKPGRYLPSIMRLLTPDL